MLLPADVDGLLSQALLLGELGPAVKLCLKEERFADAIILAQAGGADLLKQTQECYLAKKKTKISSVTARRAGEEGRGLLGPCEVDTHTLGPVFEYLPASLYSTTPTSPLPLLSALTGGLCRTPAAYAGWMADGLFPSLPITASSLCCAKELEGCGVYL